MKKLEIVVKPESLEAVKETLYNNNCTGMTVLMGMGCGIQKGDCSNTFKEITANINLLPKIQVNAVINDENLENVLSELREKISNCRVGDGKIFVYDVYDAMRVRTGERGERAISSPFGKA